MPAVNCVRLVQNFLVPHLENETFGNYLKWIDRKKGVFGVYRISYRKGRGLKNYGDVFKAWSLLKNLWDPKDPQGASKAKHRFRSALRKHQGIQEAWKEEHYHVYKLLNVEKHLIETKDDESESSTDIVDDTQMTECTHGNYSISAESSASEQDSVLHHTKKHDNQLLDYYTWCSSEAILISSPTKMPLTTQDWEYLDNIDPQECTDFLPTCFSSTRCCDILPDSKSLHNQLCIWSE